MPHHLCAFCGVRMAGIRRLGNQYELALVLDRVACVCDPTSDEGIQEVTSLQPEV